jgi:hypothetical protein
VRFAAPGHLGDRPRRTQRDVVGVDGGIGRGHRDEQVAVGVDQPDAAARGAEGGGRRAHHRRGHLDLGRRGGQVGHDLLQDLDPLLGRLGDPARGEQLEFVPAALGGVEDRGPDDPRLAVRIPAEHRIDQRGQPAAVRAHHVQGDLVHVVLHGQQRREVGLVIDLRARAQQVTEAAPADQLGAAEAGPGQERLVDLDDGPVRERGEVSARSMVVQLLGILLPGNP